MPYRLKPSNKRIVQVEKGGKWVDKYTHKTVTKAKAQVAKLNLLIKQGKIK